jgi:pimeloyl-ACP methyl ester carboxylesterase
MPVINRPDGVGVWYDTIGHGEPLVLVGGSGLASNQWEFMLPLLRDRYQLILFDQRGAGRSNRPTSGITVEQWADDLKAVLDALSIAKAHLFGTSDGSFIVIRFAAKYPESTEAVAHYGMHKLTDQARKMARVGATICDEFGIGGDSMGAYFLVRLYGIPQDFEEWEIRRLEKNIGPESWKAMQAALDVDLSEDLPKIQAPQLIVIGDSGPLGRDSDFGSGWRAVQRRSRNVELAAIPKAEGTYCVVTHPARVAREIVRFLGKNRITA